MFEINLKKIDASTKSVIRASISGNLGRLADQSLEASMLASSGPEFSDKDTVDLVDEVYEDLQLLAEIFKSPILNHIAMN